MPSDALRKRIRETRSEAYQPSHRAVAHLNRECMHLDSDPRRIDLAAYPVGHLDWCGWCLDSFRRWHRNFHGYDPEDEPSVAFVTLD